MDVEQPITPGSALHLLLNRRSSLRLVAPAPDRRQLELMLKAVARVPDFQHLHPYRFLLAQDKGLESLAQKMQRAAAASGLGDAIVARVPKMLSRAPLIVIAVASPRPSEVVPVIDQILCAGCSVLTLQLAAIALGFGAIWRTGWPSNSPLLNRDLGLQEPERIIGFLYMGTVPSAVEPAVRIRADQGDELPTADWL